jgi:hypothetical protein
MSYDDGDDRWERMYEDTVKSLAEEPVRNHLGTVGDAIEARVKQCLDDAERLRKAGFNGSALISGVTAIELIIRFLLLRPLVSGAFLSEEWESILAERIGEGPAGGDRQLIRTVLKQWGVDITAVKLPNGQPLWQSLVSKNTGVLAKRNRAVHEGARAGESDVEMALECARVMMAEVVHRIARRFGFTLEQTGTWSHILTEREDGGRSESRFRPWNPIEAKPFELPLKQK